MEEPNSGQQEQETGFTVTDPKGVVHRYKDIKQMIAELQAEQGEQP